MMTSVTSKRLAAAALICVALSGCADYLNHWDGVTFRAGNAQEANSAIHRTQQFPRVAENTRIPLGY